MVSLNKAGKGDNHLHYTLGFAQFSPKNVKNPKTLPISYFILQDIKSFRCSFVA